MTRPGYVVACGSPEPGATLLAHVLSLAGVERPAVAFVGDGKPRDLDGATVTSDPERAHVLWATGASRDGAQAVRALERGAILAGDAVSAVTWFECGVVAVAGGDPALVGGLGLVRASVCARHDDASIAGVYHGLISRLVVPPGVGIDEGAAAVFAGSRLAEVVAERPGAHAYLLEHVAGEVILKAAWARALI